MFRRSAKTNAELMRQELAEGFDHLGRAAAYGAAGVGSTMTPRWESARGVVAPTMMKMKGAATEGMGAATTAIFGPIALAAKESAGTATKAAAKSARVAAKGGGKMVKGRAQRKMAGGNRGLMLAGLITAGATAGAAGALVIRRRRQAQWDEYDAQRALDSVKSEAQSMVDTARNKVTGMADRTSEAAASGAETTSTVAHTAAEKADQAMETAKEKTDNLADYSKSTTEEIADRTSSSMRNTNRS
ncbi:MAG TPA: hypothetical protein VF054_05960 [Micromonosporaceae bacterium]